MSGRDGQWGGSQALDDNVSLNAIVVQFCGPASFVDARHLKKLANCRTFLGCFWGTANRTNSTDGSLQCGTFSRNALLQMAGAYVRPCGAGLSGHARVYGANDGSQAHKHHGHRGQALESCSHSYRRGNLRIDDVPQLKRSPTSAYKKFDCVIACCSSNSIAEHQQRDKPRVPCYSQPNWIFIPTLKMFIMRFF